MMNTVRESAGSLCSGRHRLALMTCFRAAAPPRSFVSLRTKSRKSVDFREGHPPPQTEVNSDSIARELIVPSPALPFIRQLTKTFSILFIFLFIISCTNTDQSTLTYNFKQGIAEVQLKQFPSAPPEKIYPNSQFKVIVELDNQAAYDVTDGELSLLGLDNKYFLVLPFQQTFPLLAGRSFTSPAGEKKFLEFDGTARELEVGAKEYIGNYFLTLRYNSQMELVDSVCINPNLYDVYDAGCKVQAKKSYSGQGAPLAVTNLEEITTPEASVEFRLQLVNRGKGKVKSATIGAAKLGGQEMTCLFPATGGKMFSFSQDKTERQEATIVCKALLKDQNSYVTTLFVEFSYTYELVQQQKLRLVK